MELKYAPKGHSNSNVELHLSGLKKERAIKLS